MYYSYGILLGGYFMASRSLYSLFHGSWILKFSQVFHGIFQVFFMALRPWKCHWFNHENPVKNPWIYNELFHKIFMGFDFRVCSSWCFEQIFEDRESFLLQRKCAMSASVEIIFFWAWLIILVWENEPKLKETTVNYFEFRHHQSIEEYTRDNS